MQTQISNQTTSQTNLPTEAARFLRSLESRNLTLSIQKKKSEVGDWRNEFQIKGGAAFGPDWATLNRFRPHFVRYCEVNSLVDEPFSDLSFERIPIHEKGPKTETVADMCRRAAVNLKSDERALQSKETAKMLRNLEREKVKAEKEGKVDGKPKSKRVRKNRSAKNPSNIDANGNRIDLWSKAQDEMLIQIFLSNDLWPIRQLKNESESRRSAIIEKLAESGPKRTWTAIHRRANGLQKSGLLGKREPYQLPKKEKRPYNWTPEQDAYLRVLEWPTAGWSLRNEPINERIYREVNAMNRGGKPHTLNSIKAHRRTILRREPLSDQEAQEFQRLNPRLTPAQRKRRMLDLQKVRKTAQRRAKGVKEVFRLNQAQVEFLEKLPEFDAKSRTDSALEQMRDYREWILVELEKRGRKVCWGSVRRRMHTIKAKRRSIK